MLLSALAFTACKKSTDQQLMASDANKLQTLTLGQQTIADFETTGVAPAMYASASAMNYGLVNKGGTRCGNITTTSGAHENVYTEPLDGTFTFTVANPNITLKVYTAAAVTVNFIVKVENTALPSQPVLTSTISNQAVAANTWTNLTFPFSSTNSYDKITITFEDGSTTVGRVWYFDDITTPALTYPDVLFQRVSPGAGSQLGLFIPINTGGSWYADHIAAASVMKPTDTKDGKWRLYVRGSSTDGHSTIGMFEQTTTGFDPTQLVGSGTGGWIEGTSPNPVLSYDPSHVYEESRVLSPVPVKGPNGNVVMYYTSKDNAGEKSVCLATATDMSGKIFTKNVKNPLLTDVPPGSFATGYGALTYTIYENNNYYHFNHGGGSGGSQMWISKAAQQDTIKQPVNIIARGVAGDPDSQSIEGGRLFKVTGSSLWFMVYSESATHSDYPERFHCAYATDAELQAMTPWHKVVNSKPFFLRGNAGQWDQGAMWTGDVLETSVGGTNYLYMYYEAWGKQGAVKDRNDDYFSGAHSQLGVAKVSTADFLNWVDGN